MTDTRAPKSFAVAAKNVTNDKISNNIAGDVKLQEAQRQRLEEQEASEVKRNLEKDYVKKVVNNVKSALLI